MAAPPPDLIASRGASPAATSEERPASLPATPLPRPTLRREWLLLTLALLILAGVILPPLINLGRYQHRVALAMTRSLGPPVSMRSVTLRLLPAPALVLSDVIVHEQPGFGTEPILLAPSLTAELRLSSLWRGAFEVSRVEMSEASLNLIRDSEGRWNIGSVLLQASHVANAPTAQRHVGPAPRFPYIAITDSRVNFKQGIEKLPYTLLNANLSLWLDQPEVWQLKLDAQPVRTDLALGLADTGLLRIEGQLHRAPILAGVGLGHLPLTLHVDWDSVPLGQAGRLLLGRDDGWRGELHATADLSGEIDHLRVQTHFAVANLHREEYAPVEPFMVDATCRTVYRRRARALDDLVCRWPVGGGQLLLRGSVAGGNPGSNNFTVTNGGPVESAARTRLELSADQLPASFLLAVASLIKSDSPPTARLNGLLTGSLIYNTVPGQAPVYAGAILGPSVQIIAPGLEKPLAFTRLRLAPVAPGPTSAPTLMLSADPVSLSGTAPVFANLQLTGTGFLVHVGGSASVERLRNLGVATHLLPIALARLGPEGTIDFDLTHAGTWQPSTPAVDLGTPSSVPDGAARMSARHTSRGIAQRRVFAPGMPPDRGLPLGTQGWLRLHNASYAPPFLPEAVALPLAEATILPGSVSWTVPSAVFHDLPMQVSASYPLNCAAPQPCVIQFRVATAALDAADLSSALLGSALTLGSRDLGASPVGRGGIANLLNRLGSHTDNWPSVAGTVHADTFTLGHLALRGLNANLALEGDTAHIEALEAKTLGGSLTGQGAVAIRERTPQFTVDIMLHAAGATALGHLFHENWGPGTIDLQTHLQGTGLSAAELAGTAAGTFHAEWSRGSLGSPAGPLAQFPLWTATGSIASQALNLTQGTIDGLKGRERPVTGTIGFDRALSLQIGTPPEQVRVSGTLTQPR